MKEKSVLYLYIAGLFVLVLAAFLPTIRTLMVMQLKDPYQGRTTIMKIVALDPFPAGDIPITRLFSFPGILLIAPTIVAIYLLVRLWMKFRSSRTEVWKPSWGGMIASLKDTAWFASAPEKRNIIWAMGSISLVCLAIWWGLWSRFMVPPSIGFWVYLIGIAILGVVGWVLRQPAKDEIQPAS